MGSAVGVLILSSIEKKEFEPSGLWFCLRAQPTATVPVLMCLEGLLASLLLFVEAKQFESRVSTCAGGLLLTFGSGEGERQREKHREGICWNKGSESKKRRQRRRRVRQEQLPLRSLRSSRGSMKTPGCANVCKEQRQQRQKQGGTKEEDETEDTPRNKGVRASGRRNS